MTIPASVVAAVFKAVDEKEERASKAKVKEIESIIDSNLQHETWLLANRKPLYDGRSKIVPGGFIVDVHIAIAVTLEEARTIAQRYQDAGWTNVKIAESARSQFASFVYSPKEAKPSENPDNEFMN